MAGDEWGAARLIALRAEAARGDLGHSIVIGLVAVTLSEIFVLASFGPSAHNPWFWLYIAALTLVVLASAALLVAFRLVRPDDDALLERWLPVARLIGLLFNLTVVASPWVVLPLASSVEAGVCCLIYAWFLAVTATFSTDDRGSGIVGLIGLPLSLSLYLLTTAAPMAVPLSGFFCLFGLSLAFFERRRRHAQADTMAARVTGERGAANLLAKLEAMSLIPQAVSTDARPDDVPAGGVLTPRQVEVLRHVARGKSNKEIARELSISPATVKVHVAQILATTGAGNRTAAAVSMLRQT